MRDVKFYCSYLYVSPAQIYELVGPLVRPLVGPSVTLLKFLPKSYLNRINAPVHPYATNAIVY